MKSWHFTSPTGLYTLLKYPTWLSGVNFSPAGLIIFYSFIFHFGDFGEGSRTARPIVEISEAVVTDCTSIFSLMLLEVLEGLHFISSWTKSSFGSASLFGSPLAAAWRGRFSPVWQKVFLKFETGNTAYFVLWSYHSKTSWVVLCWDIPASTQNIINNQWPHILFNWFPTVESSSVLIHFEANLFYPLKKHNATWPNWALQMVTQAGPKFNFTHFFS